MPPSVSSLCTFDRGAVEGACFAHDAVYLLFENGGLESLGVQEHIDGKSSTTIWDRATIDHVARLIRERRQLLEGDFIHTHDDAALPPLHTHASVGRPLFSKDKAGRTGRATVMPTQYESDGMSALCIVITHLRPRAKDGEVSNSLLKSTPLAPSFDN